MAFFHKESGKNLSSVAWLGLGATSETNVDYVGRDVNNELDSNAGAAELAARPAEELSADPRLPDDTRLWAALQAAGGGTWGGCVYDPDAILKKLGD